MAFSGSLNSTELVAGAFTETSPLSASTLATVGGILMIWWYYVRPRSDKTPKVYGNHNFEAPIIGFKNSLLARWQFFRNGPALIHEGYQKHNDGFFKVSGNDILIVPSKYVAELASFGPEKLSSNTAIVDAFQRFHTITDVITDHSLQTRMLTSRLTPKLGLLVPLVQQQFRKYLPQELPATDKEWTKFNALDLARRMVHRAVAVQFVTELAEDDEYMSTAISFSENGFMHHFLLRVFPDWAKPVIAFLVPTTWAVDRAFKKAKGMVIPLINERRRREQEDPDYEKPEDLLQSLMDGGEEVNDDIETTVQRLMVTYLGGGPSTMIAVAQVLFDLCAHPEYVEPLRQEALEVLREEGYTKQALNDMKQMDSFMRESQRMSPPTLLGYNSVTRQTLTLHDGTILPEGCHIQLATYEIGVDPNITPDADKFDGLRQYNNRKRPGESNRHRFTTTSETNLHFGHGKVVCPGRFFVDHSIKMIVTNIILRYHLRFQGGLRERPSNSSAYDVVIPDLKTCIEFKLRQDASEYIF